jgi:hypothetical protein
MDQMVEISSRDIASAVQDCAMLADVTISMWGAERSDPAAMESIKRDAGAIGNVGKVVKNLLAGADGLLKDTRSAFSAVRTVHYGLTLPWVSDPHAERQRGPRLLPNMLWEKYTTEIAKARSVAYAKRDEFVAAYPGLVERARSNLGTLADARYPDAEEVRAQFKIVIDMEPIPPGSAFKGLPDRVLGKLSQALQQKQQRMIQSATQAMWAEARERVGHICERLTAKDDKGEPARFKLTTIENVRELVTLLPGWNVTGDPRVEEIAADIQRMLAGVDSDAIRANDSVRADVAEQAQAVASKLSAWGL